ncbi:MAG TPA: PAS domain S-box protein [Acidimicrobiales bacterium]|nr:PAS domain S-box protein [Acidimicrobiales bacterium]
MEERLRQLVETTTTPFLATDADGAVIEWNGAAERTFGWRRDEVVGRPLTHTLLAGPLPSELRRLPPPEGNGNVVQGERALVAGRHADGRMFSLGLDAWTSGLGRRPTLNAFAYEVVEDEPPPDRCQMGSLIDFTGEPIIGTDLDNTVCTWNLAAEETFGYPAEEALGASVALLFTPDRFEELRGVLGRLGEQRAVEHETVAMRRDGTTLELVLTVSLVRDSAGAVTGYSAVARDVTEEHRMQAELDETLHGLEAELDRAREAEAQERSFLADVAHQLRTPIAGIRASADTLLKGVSPSAHERLLSGMVRETSRAARLLTSLLQIARLDEGYKLAPGPCDIVTICQEEVERASALSRELAVRVRVAGSIPDKVESDPNALREILANLLDNARRHAASRIDVVFDGDGLRVEVRVADDGPGLAPDMAEHAFDRFVSLDNKGGSGLGLPIARGLARAQGGDLTYEAGAFVIRLPAGRADETFDHLK